jgi:hypothetical protein
MSSPQCEADVHAKIPTQRRMIMAIDAQAQMDVYTNQAQQNSVEQAKKDMENKKQSEAIKGFQAALQSLP